MRLFPKNMREKRDKRDKFPGCMRSPTQAKTRLEWATNRPIQLSKIDCLAFEADHREAAFEEGAS
jgi:hypothetical protein